MKNLAYALLRLGLCWPLLILATLCNVLAACFENLSDGLAEMESRCRMITTLPYVKELEKRFQKAKLEKKKAILAELNGG